MKMHDIFLMFVSFPNMSHRNLLNMIFIHLSFPFSIQISHKWAGLIRIPMNGQNMKITVWIEYAFSDFQNKLKFFFWEF